MLITCPKCGKQYSNTSAVCIHCGEPISNYRKCPECYSWNLKTARLCAKCGYDFYNKKVNCKYCRYYDSGSTCGYYNTVVGDATTCPEFEFSQYRYDNRLENRLKRTFCYLTTACVEYYGKPDDCYELQTLRKFRDEILKKTPAGQALCEEYYRIAPPIVERLHELNDSANYEYIYSQILKCIGYIENQEYQEAINVYKEMCINMQKL